MTKIFDISLAARLSAIGVTLAATFVVIYQSLFSSIPPIGLSVPAVWFTIILQKHLLHRATSDTEVIFTMTSATMAAAIAAGFAFSLPTFFVSDLWGELRYFDIAIISIVIIVTGCLGARLANGLISANDHLPYPEASACERLLNGTNKKSLFLGSLSGFLVTVLCSKILLFRNIVENAWSVSGRVFYFGFSVSPGLFAIGGLTPPPIALAILGGSIITWGIALPISSQLTPLEHDTINLAWTLWKVQTRFLSVGAAAVLTLWLFWNHRTQLFSLFKKNYRARITILSALLVCTLILFALSAPAATSNATKWLAITWILMVAIGLSAITSYFVGYIGIAFCPWLITTYLATFVVGLLVRDAKLVLYGLATISGATLCAATMSQNLKVAKSVESKTSTPPTPAPLLLMPVGSLVAYILGTIIASIAAVTMIVKLHDTYGVATGQLGSLKAPESTFATMLIQNIVSLSPTMSGTSPTIPGSVLPLIPGLSPTAIPWTFLLAGVFIGAICIAIYTALKTRQKNTFHPLAVCIGLFLPVSLSITLSAGSLIAYAIRSRYQRQLVDSFIVGLMIGEALWPWR